MQEGHNVGARLRPQDLVVDIDPRNFPDGDDVKARFASDLNLDLEMLPRVITGSDGDHYYFQKPETLLVCQTLDKYPGVEFKTHGFQMVAGGSTHPITGRHYRVDDMFYDLGKPPELPETLRTAIARTAPNAHAPTEAGLHTPEELAQMLEGLDPCDFNSNDAWFPVMAASHHATAGAGREEFTEWSLQDPAYGGQQWVIRRRWDSLSDQTDKRLITFKTLYDLLHRKGEGGRIPNTGKAEDFVNGAGEQDAYGLVSMGEEAAIAAMNRRHFTALVGGKHYVGREGAHPTLGVNQVEFYPDAAIRRHFDRAFVDTFNADGERVKKPLGDFWLRHPRRRAYDAVVFDPTPGKEHPRHYNRWRGWMYDPNPNGSWDLLKHLLRTALCGGNEDAYSYVLKWSAFMFQQPHLPAEVAIVVRGRKGLGKGTYFRALHHLTGAHGKHVLNSGQFVGRFNEHFMDCIFLFVDEGFWAGEKRSEGALKGLITEPVLTFEPKGQPIVQGPNLLHIAIASNEEWVVPATLDERRFAILDVNPSAADASSKEFFDELYRELKAGGYGAMLHELLGMDVGDWHPRYDIPQTSGLAEQKVESFRQNPMAQFWFETLESGILPAPDDREENWRQNAVAIDPSRKDWLMWMLNADAKRLGRRGEISKLSFAKFLASVGVRIDERDKKGNRVWIVPALPEARAHFEKLLGASWQWEG